MQMLRVGRYLALFGALAPLFLPHARAQQAPAAPAPAAQAEPAPPPTIDMGLRFGLEPKAIDILKAASAKLAAAKTLSFTAVATYKAPHEPASRWPTRHCPRSRSSGPTSCG